FVLASFGLLLAAAAAARRGEAATWRRLWLLIGAYAGVLMLPGLLERITTFHMTWSMVTYLEASQAPLLLDAYRLAEGQRLFVDFNVNYGVLRGVLLAIYMRMFGPLDVGGVFRMLQVFQLLFCVAALGAYWLWYRRNAIPAAAAVLLMLPWVHNNHAALLFTNHAAWRFLGLAAGILLLIALRRATANVAALALGFGAGWLVLNNPETGIALAFGFVVSLVVRFERLSAGAIVRSALLFGAAFVAAFAAFSLVLYAGLGQAPGIAEWLRMFRNIALGSSGYA